MVSIIVCSINPELAESFRENVLATIGVECEFIIFDNRGTGLGICEVYNRCAEQAKYDYLLFAHEDILFGTQNWGAIIIEKLSDPTTGAIGFAGCTVKSKRYSGWCQMHCFVKENLVQHLNDGSAVHVDTIEKGVDFAPVVTIDGLAIFARRDVWREFRFDDELLKGFHCYDIDFSLSIATKYKNYICNCMIVEHLSQGSYNAQWHTETMRIHDEKWNDRLPMHVGDIPSSMIRKNERRMDYNFVKSYVKGRNGDEASRRKMLWSYAMRNFFVNGAIKMLFEDRFKY